MLNFLFLI